MAIKAELVSQLGGFGNRKQKMLAEHFRSAGLSGSAFGMIASPFVYKWFSDYQAGSSDYPLFSTFDSVIQLAFGFAGDNINGQEGDNPALFYLDNDGNIFCSISGTETPLPFYPHANSSHFDSGEVGGIIVDQKKRFLFAGRRYLGMYDGTISAHLCTVTLTNGSDAVVKTAGGAFTSAMVRQFLMVFSGSEIYQYRIEAYTDATHITLFPNVTLPTGSYSAYVCVQTIDRWKDFGTEISANTSDGYDRTIPTENYEDTVLFGRANNITTLNILTDTVTTDASPAFNMPEGFDCLSIHQGANGILMGFNFNGKGFLVLWDNYSDRAIAPWIPLNDRLISMCKYKGNWIVITSREIFETNGYSLTLVAEKVLDMDIDPLAPQIHPQTSYVLENDLHFITDFSLHGKRRAGLHKMNLETKLIEYIPRGDMEQKTDRVNCIEYGASPARLYIGQTDSLGYVENSTQSPVSSFISNAVGQGDNIKHAEAIKLNLGISPSYYGLLDETFSFEVAVKICPLNQQTFTYGLVKTTQTVATELVVNESVYGVAEVGDEIEIVMGNNAGYSRNIVSKSGSGATVTYTLDRALPALCTANDYFFRTKFQLVSAKTFTNVTEIKPELLHFNVKNKTKGKQFLVKVDIEDATVPLEVRPFYFIYDDLGIF